MTLLFLTSKNWLFPERALSLNGKNYEKDFPYPPGFGFNIPDRVYEQDR
jgi:hypothetical protein